jgi:hypothetical protein
LSVAVGGGFEEEHVGAGEGLGAEYFAEERVEVNDGLDAAGVVRGGLCGEGAGRSGGDEGSVGKEWDVGGHAHPVDPTQVSALGEASERLWGARAAILNSVSMGRPCRRKGAMDTVRPVVLAVRMAAPSIGSLYTSNPTRSSDLGEQ